VPGILDEPARLGWRNGPVPAISAARGMPVHTAFDPSNAAAAAALAYLCDCGSTLDKDSRFDSNNWVIRGADRARC
jgi:hypothetical protein